MQQIKDLFFKVIEWFTPLDKKKEARALEALQKAYAAHFKQHKNFLDLTHAYEEATTALKIAHSQIVMLEEANKCLQKALEEHMPGTTQVFRTTLH